MSLFALLWSCSSTNSEVEGEEKPAMSDSTEDLPIETSDEEEAEKFVNLGEITFTIKNQEPISSNQFIVEEVQFPLGAAVLEWLNQDPEGGNVAIVMKTDKLIVLSGVLGKAALADVIEGELPISSSNEESSTASGSIQFEKDGKASMFSFGKGKTNIKRIDASGKVQMTITGTGMYVPDMSNMAEIVNDQEATLMLDVQMAIVNVNGERVHSRK